MTQADEFHHAVAGNYEKILNYFEPRFLLGLTATPERMDNEDVFALCDYNVVYEVRLKEAINKGWLVPFRYYGIYDPTNYEKITYKNGQYNVEELEAALTHKDRARLVLNNYSKYSSNCCLAFCMNVRHATEMAQFFTENGVPARAVVSSISSLQQNAKSFVIERQEGISQLISGRINVIFSVDMFNEGLDVPNIDLILFLRPTESPTVFLQQLGRGLRTHRGKLYVNVLDFIGNYKKANLIPFILIDSKSAHNRKSGEKTKGLPEEKDFPEGCLIDFDFKILDLFKKMEAAQKVYFEDIVAEEYRISENIGRRALRLELYTYMREELVRNALTKNDLNIFKDFLGHLDKIGELDEEERILVGTVAHEFLKELEKTAMSRLYKMPVLLGFYNNGEFKMEVDNYDIAENFKAFYANHANAIDLENQNSTKDFMNWDLNKYITLAKKNPMKSLMESAPQFFSMKDDRFCLSEDLEPYIKNRAFVRHFKDIIDYRTRRFYKERLEKKVAK